MDEILWETLTKELESNHPCVLSTVLSQSGSTPRGAGAVMLLLRNGSVLGTVGGGAVEHAVERQATECMDTGTSRLLSYCLAPNEIQDLGMVCGGSVKVHCHYFNPQDPLTRQVGQAIAKGLHRDISLWLTRRIENSGAVTEMELVTADSIVDETIKARCVRHAVMSDDSYFTLPIRLEGHAYIFGGGHIAQKLAPLLHELAFSPVIYDDRIEFTNPALFANTADTLLGSFTAIDEKINLKDDDYAVVMTRGHAHDNELLAQILRTPVTYIGLIGSRSKIGKTKAQLFELGFTEDDFNRVHTPIGLAIGAETPAEIAVSVAAEMILHRARQNGSSKVPR
ncbi:MAG: XdhC family protein [Eubacteriales bacterium]|nr:XdhC family protein [Eubacteriales bacterium]